MASFQEIVGSEAPEQRKKRLNKERQIHYRKKQKTEYKAGINLIDRQHISIKHHELKRMDQICVHCGAKFWIEEKDHSSNKTSPTFAVCCAGGKVSLQPLLKPPSYLLNLYTSSGPNANSFRKNIRGYNSLLACTSFGANIDEGFQRQGVSNFQIHGQVYHCIGSLLPENGQPPMFAQLYIYDTEHESRNRHNIMQDLDNNILLYLQNMLDTCNPYIKTFRQARDIILSNATLKFQWQFTVIEHIIHTVTMLPPLLMWLQLWLVMVTVNILPIEILSLDCIMEICKEFQKLIHHMILYTMYFYFQKGMMAGISTYLLMDLQQEEE
jgi:hypothetical protein